MPLLFILTIILCLILIVLVTLQPRQTQIFSNDVTSNIGKPSYWSSQPLLKFLTLVVAVSLFVILIIFMIISYN